MIKWIKKNTRYFLIAFGVLLMIVFIVPQQVLQSDGGGRTAFTLDGQKYSHNDTKEAADSVRQYVRYRPNFAMVLGLDDRSDPGSQWIMLTEDARRAGLMGAAADAEPIIDEMARAAATQEIQNMFRSGAIKQPTTPEENQALNAQLDSATAAYRTRLRDDMGKLISQHTSGMDVLSQGHAAERLLEQYIEIPAISEQRFIKRAREQQSMAEVQYLVVPIDENAAKNRPAVTEADLTAFFDKYRDVPAGKGEYGIGYRQPNRVRLAWIKIDKNLIKSLVTVDPIEVQKRLIAAKPPAGQEAAERARIESEIRTALTDRAMGVARDTFKRFVLLATSKLPDDGQYKALPADFKPIDPVAAQETILAELADKAGIRLNSFARGSQASLVPLADAGKGPELVGAVIRRGADGRNDLDISQTFAALRDFKPSPEVVSRVRIPVQVGLPVIEPFEDSSGSLYYITALEAKPEAAPANISEVRDQVVIDKKRVDALNELTTQGAAYALAAAELGLAELETSLKAKGLAVRLVKNGMVARPNRVIPNDPAIMTPEYVNAVMSVADKLDVKQKFDQSNMAARTVAVPLPASLSVAIVQITQYYPLTLERARMLAGRELQQLRATEVISGFAQRDEGWPFTHASMAKRLKVEYATSNEKAKGKDAKSETKPAADSAPATK